MLCGDLAVMQAPGFDSLSFDPFSLFQDGLSPSEVDIGRGHWFDPSRTHQFSLYFHHLWRAELTCLTRAKYVLPPTLAKLWSALASNVSVLLALGRDMPNLFDVNLFFYGHLIYEWTGNF